LDDLQLSLSRCARQGLRHHRAAWQNFSDRLSRVRPAALLRQRRDALDQRQRRLRELTERRLRDRRDRLRALESRLRLLGPEQVLARGYSITQDAATGKVVREASRLKAGQKLRTRLQKGEALSSVETPEK
ncbi:MAG TPA: exodeoxyribonuclease VII large subunit, partial [Verrucomicrobiae bacterium]|nr:exodeoxyribonuclease VII large subunit [Verrucomicrobiae bacterium]